MTGLLEPFEAVCIAPTTRRPCRGPQTACC